MIEGQDIVVVSGEFGRYPSSIEHLMRQFLPTNRILWVEITGMRRPNFSLYDLKRAAAKVRRLTLGAAAVEGRAGHLPEGMHLVSPLTLPLPELSLVRHFNDNALLKKIKTCTGELGFKNYGLITTLPMAADALPRSGSAWSIYYCPDEWSLWPGMNEKLVKSWESRLLNTVDAVVVPSKQLQIAKSTATKRATIVSHGVDVRHFAKAWSNSSEERATFFGLFDDRLDQQLLESASLAFPQCTFEMIGPVQCKLNPALTGNQFDWQGQVPYQELPQKLRRAKVLMLPYLQNELTKNINPLKARECIATGKPVVAMRIPELEGLQGVELAATHADFIEILGRLLKGSVGKPAATEGLEEDHSWAGRASEFSKVIVNLIIAH